MVRLVVDVVSPISIVARMAVFVVVVVDHVIFIDTLAVCDDVFLVSLAVVGVLYEL